MLEEHAHGPVDEVQLPDARQEGQAQKLRHLGGHLTGVRIDRVAPAEHQIPGAVDLEGAGQSPGRGQRVAPGERRVGHVQAGSAAAQDRLTQDSVGLGWPERDGRAGTARGLGKVAAGANGPSAVVVHVEFDAAAHQASVVAQAHLLELGDLLDQCGDSKGPVGGRGRHGVNVPAPRRRTPAGDSVAPWPATRSRSCT